MFKNIANFNDTNDYLPLINAILFTDLFVILLVHLKIFNSKFLANWYSKYNLSAVIADVLIILIVLIITRALYYYIFETYSLLKFIILALIIQITHDILFYIFFNNIPIGVNKMLDTFKDYAKEVSYKAILGDSLLIIMSCIIAAFLANKNTNTNIIVLVSFLYVLPYLLYK